MGNQVVLALLSRSMRLITARPFPGSQMAFAKCRMSVFAAFLAPWYRWDSVLDLVIADPAYKIYGIVKHRWPRFSRC